MNDETPKWLRLFQEAEQTLKQAEELLNQTGIALSSVGMEKPATEAFEACGSMRYAKQMINSGIWAQLNGAE